MMAVKFTPPHSVAENCPPIQVVLSRIQTNLMSVHQDGPMRWLFCCKQTMNQNKTAVTDNARASPVSDVCRPHPTGMRYWQGLPIQGQNWSKKLAQNQTRIQNLCIAMLNIGIMTGQGCKLMDMLMRCKVDIVCIQETQWKGQKSQDIVEGYKLIYCGMTNQKV